MRRAGLRVDVDTLRGTREGVPRLAAVLASHGVHATFFFSVGPDNMGRHAWRLLNPAFAAKMLRSNAPALYGWDILLAGLLWPGKRIGRHCSGEIRAIDAAGHEVGLHAWDHHGWQAGSDRMGVAALRDHLRRGVDALGDILGRAPSCSAAPGWKCNNRVLEAEQDFGFRFSSDCRGYSPFLPIIDGREGTVQIPTTLPTFDEAIGRDQVTVDNYNEWLLDRAAEQPFSVLTVHAEVEGIVCASLFERFLAAARARGIEFEPLGALLDEDSPLERSHVVSGHVAGRAATLAVQQRSPAH
jgi:undecaprenyl phosphate-alpha-L-ara4FN deformylase